MRRRSSNLTLLLLVLLILGMAASLALGSEDREDATVSVLKGGREEALTVCVSLQQRWKKPGSDGIGCGMPDRQACAREFEKDLGGREVAQAHDEAIPFMERCCHVWDSKIDTRNPFADKPCGDDASSSSSGSGGAAAAASNAPPSATAVKLCVAAQDRWRRGGIAKCTDFHSCSLDFSREVQAMSEDNPGDAGALSRCCLAWESSPNKSNPFAGQECIRLPHGGRDISGGKSAGGPSRGDPSGAIAREQDHIARLKAQLRNLVARHRECNRECEGRPDKKLCARKCCKAKKAAQKKVNQEMREAERKRRQGGRGGGGGGGSFRNDVHLVHRAIVSWVRRMVTTVEKVAEHDSVPSVVHAMAKVFCRKIQLRFNPTACVSGRKKCNIKFRDAVGVLKFPRGPRHAPSPYAKFIAGKRRGGKDVEWCQFDWDEAKAREQARKLAKRRLREALRRRALAKARVAAARAAAREKDQEERDSKATMDLSQFVVLAPGAKGPDAVALRFLLIAAGLFKGAPVGDYDGEVVKVVQKDQERHGAKDDGIVNGAEWKRLVEKNTIRKWRKNNEFAVRAVQYLLKFKYSRGALKVCGVYNRETVATVKDMQRKHGLPVTGAIGAREWPMLLADLDTVPKGMSTEQCNRRMGLVLGGEKAKSGKDCLEKDVYSNECCRIRAVFNCDKRSKDDIAKGLLFCREQSRLADLKRKKEEEERKKRELEEKAARAAMEWQRCGSCKFVTLHVGDKGPEVAALRYLMEEWEILPAQQQVVELFDLPLTTVIQKLQKDKGLIPTGVVGTQTWLRLIGPEFLWKRAKFDRAIMGLQYLLKTKFGAAAVQINGKYDAATEAAVRAFQRAAKLKEDGMVGGHTWSALLGKAEDSRRLLSRLAAAGAEQQGSKEYAVLQEKDEGPLVAALKYLLKEHNLLASNNAIYDEATSKIVAIFRDKFKLDKTKNRVGPNMWKALVNAGAVLKKGVSRPDAIRAVQYILKHKFGVNISVDGQFSDAMEAAIRQFQAGNGIPEEGGTVGPKTWQKLLAAGAALVFGGNKTPQSPTSTTSTSPSTPLQSKFTSIQTESEIEEEITGLVRAVTQNLDTKSAAAEVCKALQAKFGAPDAVLRRPGCLDGRLHCAEGFFYALGAVKRLTKLGPELGSCQFKY